VVKVLIPIAVLVLAVSGLFVWKNKIYPSPKNYQECLLSYNAVLLNMFPGKCTTWLGNTFTQPLTKEQKERLKPLDAPTASTSATANWKTYSNNGLFFKYPPEAELNQAERVKDEFNEGGTEITVTYIRPGYNWPQTDISDGYVFSIAWGEVIGFGTVKEVSQKRYAQLKDSNAFPQMTALTETKIANQSAYCLEQGPVFYGRTCYAGNEGTIFEIDFFSSSSDVKQKQNYDLVLSQILSTFKFINQSNTPTSVSNGTIDTYLVQKDRLLDTSGWKTYESKNNKFTVKYPQNWFLAEDILSNWKMEDQFSGLPTNPTKCDFYGIVGGNLGNVNQSIIVQNSNPKITIIEALITEPSPGFDVGSKYYYYLFEDNNKAPFGFQCSYLSSEDIVKTVLSTVKFL